jgi:hypothetical protein
MRIMKGKGQMNEEPSGDNRHRRESDMQAFLNPGYILDRGELGEDSCDRGNRGKASEQEDEEPSFVTLLPPSTAASAALRGQS